QRIHAGDAGLVLLEGAGVDEERDALARGDAEGIVALGTHATGPLHLGTGHDLLARIALDPQAFGDDDLLRRPLRLLRLAREPGHGLPPQWRLEGFDERAELIEQLGGAGVALDEAHDGRADEDAVGQLAAPRRLLLRGHAEAHPHGTGGGW